MPNDLVLGSGVFPSLTILMNSNLSDGTYDDDYDDSSILRPCFSILIFHSPF